MNNFVDMVEKSKIVLTEGGMVERIRRGPSVELDPYIVHTGLIYEQKGREILKHIYSEYIGIAQQYGLPTMSLAPTWRANLERLKQSRYSRHRTINRDCVQFLQHIREGYGEYANSIFIGGVMACKRDAYRPQEALSQEEVAQFHRAQAESLAQSGVDFILVATLPAMSEAHGIAAAIAPTNLPYILGFVVRPEGTLLDGTPLHKAIECIDAEIQPSPFFYMINCVHPTIFEQAMSNELQTSTQIVRRILGLQANTSSKSPEELDQLAYLDTSEPDEFAESMVAFHQRFGIKVLGGCCGSDSRHIAEIAKRVSQRVLGDLTT